MSYQVSEMVVGLQHQVSLHRTHRAAPNQHGEAAELQEDEEQRRLASGPHGPGPGPGSGLNFREMNLTFTLSATQRE